MNEEIQLAVKKGAYWLDTVYPEWTGHINLETLDLLEDRSCILGQVIADSTRTRSTGYWLTFEYLAQTWGSTDAFAWLSDHGFVNPPDDDYPLLTEAWRNLLIERGVR